MNNLRPEFLKVDIAALVAYDGTDYSGFQYQVEQSTIQGELEEALSKVVQVHCRIIGSGRTDAGVHASGQVVHTNLPWKHNVRTLLRAWNAHLPSDIVVRQVYKAPPNFHSRFSAKSRTYTYTIYQSENELEQKLTRRSPLTDRFSLLEQNVLEINKMVQAGEYLLGLHDFGTFGNPPQGTNTVRLMQKIDIQEHISPLPIDGLKGRYITITITANAFLRQMVRNIVGTLLDVGRKRRSPDDVKAALLACDRSQCAPPAPARGLTLQRVWYPDYPQLFR